MENSLILRSPAIATNADRPKFTRDPMVRPGTKFLYDWSRGRCHPSGAIAAGVIAGGAEMFDLGHDDITAATAATGFTAEAAGGLINTSESGDYIAIGAAGQFDMAPAEYEYVLTAWIKLPASGHTTSNFMPLLGLSSDNTAANAQVWIDMGLAGRRPRCAIGSSYIYGATSDISLGAVYQLGIHYRPAESLLDFYMNGALVQGSTGPASVASAAAAQFRVTALVKKTLYRVSLTDITASLAAEEAQGFPANARLSGPQHILREYQFCTNQIGAAPKAIFA